MPLTPHHLWRLCLIVLLVATCLDKGGARLAFGQDEDINFNIEVLRAQAEQGDAEAQCVLGICLDDGLGVPKDSAEALKWYRRAADQGNAMAQGNLGHRYVVGEGVPQDYAEAFKWFRRAAEQGHVLSQYSLGVMYDNGNGVPKDSAEALKWYRRAAEQGYAAAQTKLGYMYAHGKGVPEDYVQAYVWLNLGSAQGDENGRKNRDIVRTWMTPAQIAEAQRISSEFRPRPETHDSGEGVPRAWLIRADASGSGFFVTGDGFFVTNHHVVADANRISVVTVSGTHRATIAGDDPANDLAVLKVEGTFTPLYVRGSRGLRTGDEIAAVGFGNPDIQGLTAKYSEGVVAALSGPAGDPRLLQVSLPVQPGNSGGPLVDERGRAVGVVVGQLDKVAAFAVTGSLPENVNYAIRGTILLGVLEAVPGLMEKMKPEAGPAPGDAADVAVMVEQACGLVLVEK